MVTPKTSLGGIGDIFDSIFQQRQHWDIWNFLKSKKWKTTNVQKGKPPTSQKICKIDEGEAWKEGGFIWWVFGPIENLITKQNTVDFRRNR